MLVGIRSAFVLLIAALFVGNPLWAAPGGPGGGGRGGPGGGPSGGFDRGGFDRGGLNHGGPDRSGFDRGGFDRTAPTARPGGATNRAVPYRAPGGNAAHLSHYGPPGHPVAAHGYYHPNYGAWYHGDWHDHWARPWYYGPSAWVSVGFVAGAVVWDAPWYWGYWSYYNPYCVDVVVVDGTVIDYSRPIVVAMPPTTTTTAAAPVADTTQADNQAMQLLDASRTAFGRGDYPGALNLVHKAIGYRPNDPVLHQFRGLILFATGQYRPATAAVYAALSVQPGWDWATLRSFYPNPEVYTQQLRALEQYRNQNPTLPEVRFLLAYHYMSCGQNDAAAREFREAVRLNPKDQLSAQLVAGLTADQSTAAQPAAAPATPAAPINAALLVGDWQCNRGDGASFAFNISADGTFRWQYTQQGKAQQFTGAYTVADNLLILKRNGQPTMIGQVTPVTDQEFNFKLVGSNAGDPGLTFSRK